MKHAVGLGFEPRRLAPSAFKADAIVHSAIPPHSMLTATAYKTCRLSNEADPVVVGRDGEITIRDPLGEVRRY